MSEAPARLVAQHVHDLIERQRLDALPDRALLDRFHRGDEAAFAALVRRHGPMVLGVCRRILRHAQDAEDACQAVFLVLARKGRTVRGADSLAGWLHRVAVRAATRLRRGLVRRAVEPLPPEVHAPEPTGDELVWREVRQIFDAEVGRLPDRLRLPLVLCCLQGKTRSEAAAELGWSEGAVRGRLERGRRLLRSRFGRKGLTLPAALLSLLVEEAAPATTPAVIASPSTVAARLADGLVRSMVLARAKLAAWTTAAVLLAGTAVGVGLYGPATAQPKSGDPPAAAAEAPAATLTDAQKNLDTFVLRVSLAPAGDRNFDPKYSLYHVLLYVPNLRLEPPANGPDGKPVEAHARITKEQAKRIVDTLTAFDFFKDDAAFDDPKTRKLDLLQPVLAGKWPHAGIAVRFQNGEDPARRERLLLWLPQMLPPLDAIRECVDGAAAEALDQLLGQLAEDRRKWAPDALAEDLKRLQGSWAVDLTDNDRRLGLESGMTAKCVIDGKKITLKPTVQLDPLLDLETIRGTFDLSAGPPRKMTIKAVRDTVARREPGTWTLLYEAAGDILKLLLPPAGSAPPAAMDPRPDKGERLFVLKRQATGPVSEWGEHSSGVQARIRASKARYTEGEAPSIELDVRDTHAGVAGQPWHWWGRRLAATVRIEVDGVWHRNLQVVPNRYVPDRLDLGQTVEKWATVSLAASDWGVDGESDKPRLLNLKPGKHTVRIGCDFNPSEGGRVPAAPISGALEIEVAPRVPASKTLESDWGAPSNLVEARIRTPKNRYAAGEAPTFDLDVRDTHAGAGPNGPWHWLAPRVPGLARIEVDGVWYQYADLVLKKVVPRPLAFGQTVDTWVTVALDDQWESGRPPGPPMKLPGALKPGRHTVRIAYEFQPSEGHHVPAKPISGPLEIEIVTDPAGGHQSDWGESAKGLSTRIRTAKATYAFGEPVVLALDVKAAGDGTREPPAWQAAKNSSPARLELGGFWYKRIPDEVGKELTPTLKAGEQVDGWATLDLSDGWFIEYFTGIPPGQAGQRLTLAPGKYRFRVAFSFSNPTGSAVPVTGPLAIEVLPPKPAAGTTGKAAPPATGSWRSTAAWTPYPVSGPRHLAIAPDDKHLFTAGKDGLTLWDISGPEPKAEQKVSYTTQGLTMAGLDRDGLPLLVRRLDRPQPRGAQADLTILRLPDMDRDGVPTVTVDADKVRLWAVGPDGRSLAVAAGDLSWVRLVDAETRKDRPLEAVATAGKVIPYPHALLFSRDGKTLIGLGSNDYPVSGWNNGLIVCWDTDSGKIRWKCELPDGQGVGALSPDGRTLVTGGSHARVVTVWDAANGTRRATVPATWPAAVAVSPDGRTVVAGGHTDDAPRKALLEVWDLSGDKPTAQTIPVPATIQRISFRDDGRAFATADATGEVRWWAREK